MKTSLVVGVPKEIKRNENRVGLTPAAVRSLTDAGVPVLVQIGAGELSSFPDADYLAAGAQMVPGIEKLYAGAQLIQKVKEPQPEEFALLDRHILFCFLHLASPENKPLLRALIQSRCTAIGFEILERQGQLPVLAPMSRIAGALSAAYGAFFQPLHLQSSKGRINYPEDFHSNLRKIAGYYPDFSGKLKIGKTVIFGGGVAGRSALEAAISMQGDCAIVETDSTRRTELMQLTPNVFSLENLPQRVLEDAKILIGCVHRRGEKASQVMDLERLSSISRKTKKIILDIAIDQGGNFPEAHSTSYQDPLYQDSFGNLRFAVPNIPSFCGRRASEAISEAAGVYTKAIALEGQSVFAQMPELANALYVADGKELSG